MATFHKQDFSFCHFIRLTVHMERRRQAMVITQSARLGAEVRSSFLDNGSNLSLSQSLNEYIVV